MEDFERECYVRGTVRTCDQYRWDEYDARGIYLCKVCERCERDKLAAYRPEVLTDPGYELDEEVYPDD